MPYQPKVSPIRVTTEEYQLLKLNCRQLKVLTVFVDEARVKFQQNEFFEETTPKLTPKDLAIFTSLHSGNLQASLAGDLSIFLPETHDVEKEFIVRIIYELKEPKAGIYFKHCEVAGFEKKLAHVYTDYGLCSGEFVGGNCGPQNWFPCINSFQDRSIFIFQVICPYYLTPITVGNNTRQHDFHRNLKKMKLIRFEHTEPVCAFNIGFAVGFFTEIKSEKLPAVSYYVLNGKISHSRKDLGASYALEKLPGVFQELQDYLGKPYPFQSFKIVFICGAVGSVETASPFSTFSICSDSLLLGTGSQSKIECLQFPLSKSIWIVQAMCVAYNYFGALVSVEFVVDVWLIPGLIWFLSFHYLRSSILKGLLEEENAGCFKGCGLRHRFDPKEMLFEVQARVIAAFKRHEAVKSIHGRAGCFINRTLEQPKHTDFPVDALLWQYRGMELHCLLSCKAFFVIHVLEQKNSTDTLKKMLRAWINFDVEDFPGISMKDMFSRLKSLSNDYEKIYDRFFASWLTENKLLSLQGVVKYNKRPNGIEILIHTAKNSVKGQVKIRVVENDAPWDHDRSVLKDFQELPIIHCKSQPHREKGGRKPARELDRIQIWDTPENQTTEKLLELAGGKDLSLGAFIQRRKRSPNDEEWKWWRKKTPVKYVLFDPDFCWLGELRWRQDDEIMTLELLHDHDVENEIVLQSNALFNLAVPLKLEKSRILGSTPSKEDEEIFSKYEYDFSLKASLRAASAIAACIIDYPKPVMVRVAAIEALAMWQVQNAPLNEKDVDNKENGSWVGLEFIKIAFSRLFMTSGLLLHNDFDVAGEFQLKIAMVKALGQTIRAKNGVPHRSQFDFLMNLLRFNDNSKNRFADDLYVGELMFSTASCIADTVEKTRFFEKERAMQQHFLMSYHEKNIYEIISQLDFDEFLEVLNRKFFVDLALNHGRNYIAAKCLEAYAVLYRKGILAIDSPRGVDFKTYALKNITEDLEIFFSYELRFTAIKSFIDVYIFRPEDDSIRGQNWFISLLWVLQILEFYESTLVQINIFKYLLKIHADTINIKHKELENNTSPAGIFYPLANSIADLKKTGCYHLAHKVGEILWRFLTKSWVYNNQLLSLVHQFWRSLWGLSLPPIFRSESEAASKPEMGPYANWHLIAELEESSSQIYESDSETPVKNHSLESFNLVNQTKTQTFAPTPFTGIKHINQPLINPVISDTTSNSAEPSRDASARSVPNIAKIKLKIKNPVLSMLPKEKN